MGRGGSVLSAPSQPGLDRAGKIDFCRSEPRDAAHDLVAQLTTPVARAATSAAKEIHHGVAQPWHRGASKGGSDETANNATNNYDRDRDGTRGELRALAVPRRRRTRRLAAVDACAVLGDALVSSLDAPVIASAAIAIF